ncbi:unnamed protein product [marine sediment metagenome]|uniref:Uncharacterized protein n=1 Tax=marine sediment metagenome TaxID=412755 RepID=X1IP96_9ZZZZ
MENFLPKVIVTTIVWADKDILEHSKWEAAQGDDLKNNRSTIELNLPKLKERGNIEAIAKGMVESWLGIQVIFATRQDLIDKRVRGNVSEEGHKILYDANLKTIMVSPYLKKSYTNLAVENILNAEWVIDETYSQLASEVKSQLKALSTVEAQKC